MTNQSTDLKTSLQSLSKAYGIGTLTAVSFDETCARASQLMKERNLSHLPVILEDGTIVGLISEKDLSRRERTSLNNENHVRDFMNWPVETIDESRPISEAAKLMLEKKISALLITNGDVIRGLVTTDDLLRAFVEDQESRRSDHASSRTVARDFESALYTSPVGSIAQVLADAGL